MPSRRGKRGGGDAKKLAKPLPDVWRHSLDRGEILFLFKKLELKVSDTKSSQVYNNGGESKNINAGR